MLRKPIGIRLLLLFIKDYIMSGIFNNVHILIGPPSDMYVGDTPFPVNSHGTTIHPLHSNETNAVVATETRPFSSMEIIFRWTKGHVRAKETIINQQLGMLL